MSKRIRAIPERPCADIVRLGEKTYYVDTDCTFDMGWETMVFPYDETKEEVSSWIEVYTRHYTSFLSATSGHGYICDNLETFI